MLTQVVHAFNEGGWPMWPILGCQVFAMAIVMERFFVISSAAKINKEELLKQVRSYVMKGSLEKAVSYVSKTRSPLTNIILSGLVSVVNGQNEEEVQTAMDAVALKEIPRLERNIGVLAAISNMATLVGLLGTVIGMIGAFSAVATAAPSEKATFLAASISEAMNCTAFGLIVAIPTLAAYVFFNNWSQRLVDDIHEASVSTLNFILTNRARIEQKGKA